MISDLTGAIQTCGNYLAALGLACYTETCGRDLVLKGGVGAKDWECFNAFIKYMGAEEVLKWRIKYLGRTLYFKDAIRNGLAHEYFIKADSGGVAMISDRQDAKRTGFCLEPSGHVSIVVVPYFNLFTQAIVRWHEDEAAKNSGA